MELLYDGPHIQVLFRQGSSPYALVTFNGRGFKANGKAIWAQPLAEKLDLTTIGFVTKAPTWFPEEDMARACAAALPALAPFAERIGYGYSQGGYAAIRASRILGLTQTIAVSPQCSIDPSDIKDPRFNPFFAAELHPNMRVVGTDAPKSLHMFYDRGLPLDREHVERIMAEIPSGKPHHVPFTDHGTVRALLGSSAFPNLLAGIVNGAPEAVVSQMRRRSLVRKSTMILRAIRTGRMDRAARLFEAISLDADRRSLLLARFAEVGAADYALPHARRDVVARPDNPMANAALAYVLVKAGKPIAARRRIDAVRAARAMRGRVRGLIERAEEALEG